MYYQLRKKKLIKDIAKASLYLSLSKNSQRGFNCQFLDFYAF